MRIAICDDTVSHAERVEALLKSHEKYADSETVIYTESKALLDAVSSGECFDIAFLDVDMPYINGPEPRKQLRDKSERILIVFVSTYPQYAIRAFDCKAFSYFMKPIENHPEAISVLDRLCEKYVKFTYYRTVRINTLIILSILITINANKTKQQTVVCCFCKIWCG